MSLESRFNLSMSAAALRIRYAEEREKRLRPDGNAQYTALDEGPDELCHDPYIGEVIQRESLNTEYETVIVGGGFGGMLQGAHLRKQGLEDFVIIDAAGDFGGTWYWNRYPGAACDIESYIYLPLLDETGYVPTEKYAKAPEIHAYCQQLARHFRLYDTALFQTQVTSAVWNKSDCRWHVGTNRGDHISARNLIIAGGTLHKAKLPDVQGIEIFKGKSFHTSRWDYAFTGGSPVSPMHELSDKKVGIIGTGATAIQAIPRLAEAAGHLYVFQRTPSGISVRGNRATDQEWADSLRPGWQEERLANFVSIMSGRRPPVDLVDDGWTHISLSNGAEHAGDEGELEEAAELADLERMEAVRARVDLIVKDKSTADLLKPWYGQWCKRPCFHDEYLQVFNQPNVTLVDTKGNGVRELNANGILMEGKEYPLDLLIYASGFEVTTAFTHRIGFDPVGPGGASLSAALAESPEMLHGTFVRHFPNLFLISTMQGGQMPNFVHMIHNAAIHIAHVLRWAKDCGVETIEPKRDAAEAWMNVIFGTLMQVARYNGTCTPGYANNEGNLGDISMARRAPYMGAPDEFLAILKHWRDSAGEERDLDVTYAAERTR